MCVAPQTLKDGTEIPCRACWQCDENRVNDLVGRCLAEQATSDQSFSVTLTYAGDVPNAAVLCYRDVQLFLKRLRKAGCMVRYIVAGEYGTNKGRAHWHAVFFLRMAKEGSYNVGRLLDIVDPANRSDDWQIALDTRIKFAPWSDHASTGGGFCYFQQPDYGGFRYALKYALKNQRARASVKSLSMSKMPPLGHDFFMKMADDLVERGLPVQLPTYQFRGQKDKNGRHRTFCLQGRMRDMFLDHYAIAWRLVHGTEPPASEWYQERYLAKIEWQLDQWDPELLNRDIRNNAIDFKWRAEAFAKTQSDVYDPDAPGWLPEMLYQHCFVYRGNPAYITVYRDHALVELNNGYEPWRIGKGEESSVEEQLLRSGLNRSSLRRVLMWLLYAWRKYPDKKALPL